MTVSIRDGERAGRAPVVAAAAQLTRVQLLRSSDLTGGAMVRRTYPQRSLIEVLLPNGDKLWDPVLRQIDALLEDEDLLDHVTAALARRHPLSTRRGRLGTPAAVVLRMLVLKHLSDWSFDECEREVRGSLVYRAFCKQLLERLVAIARRRIDGEGVPDAKTLIRLAHVLDGPVLQRRLVPGRRLRVDTTVVETTVHYPADITLLADEVRVLTRTMKQLTARLAASPVFLDKGADLGADGRATHRGPPRELGPVVAGSAAATAARCLARRS